MVIKRISLTVVALCLICGSMGGPATPAMAAIQKDLQDCNQAADPDRQIAGCTRAIAFPPARNIRSNLLNNRAIAWVSKGDYDRAFADYDEAIRLDPKNAFLHDSRGSAWFSKGEFDRAFADYDEAIRLDPKNPSPHNYRGGAWASKGEYDRAIADFTEVIRLSPTQEWAYNDRGLAWKDKREFDLAIADFNEAIRRSPKFALAYANRGEVWRLKGDLERALADQDQAVALAPKGIINYAYRGDTLRYKGEFARAIADYEHALQNAGHDYIPALTGLGLTYEKMGDLAKARTKFEEARDSLNKDRILDPSPSSLETARARLAALDSGVAQPTIPVSLPQATSATSIPTSAIAAPTVAPAAAQASAAKFGRRVALVIGNSAYKNVPALPNPQKDAEAIAASLRNIGFDSVMVSYDATREKLVEGLRAFAEEADKAEWAVVYYAGHGIEVGGQNYLIPTDAKLATDRDVQFEAIPLGQILGVLHGAKKLKLILLDACRVNPFSRQMRMTEVVASDRGGIENAGTRSIGRGLGRVDISSGPTLVVFAAKDGQTALDGDGANSPFAIAMVQRIATPGVEINKLFRLVRDDVMEATAGRQEPYTYGSLPGKEDFFFVAK
jgi:tetratricopeptide (TPR) repeat protein